MITKGQIIVIMLSLIFILSSFVPYAFLKPPHHRPLEEAKEEIMKLFPDIDGDLLDDNIELNITFTSITSPDTDKDFLPDGAEFEYWNETYNQYGLDRLKPTGDADGDGLTNILDPDSDNDFVPDGWEFENGLELWKHDTDNDGYSDRFNYYRFYNLFGSTVYADGDHDMLPDDWENYFGAYDPEADEDGDGVNNINEHFNGSDPMVRDDRYGFKGDQDEYSDRDRDGLTDRLENAIGLDPNSWDSDLDGEPDGWEILNGSLPFDPDTDGDNITDWNEVLVGLSPASTDSDKDGLNDREELVTDPLVPDSNKNLVLDGDEPSAHDIDRDRLSNLLEMDDTDGFTTDPLNSDTDNDDLADGVEDENRNGRRDGNDPTDTHSDWGRGGETDPNEDDTDEGGTPDGIEIMFGLDPLDPSDDDFEYEPPDRPVAEPPEKFEIDLNVCLLILLIILIIIIAIVASYYLRKRREKLIKDLIEILEKGERELYELDTSDEIRNAIYKVYISFQNALVEFSLFRKDSMTVREFEVLVDESLPLRPEPVSRLTEVFEEARYSDHKMGVSSKDRAIKSFREIRLDLTRYGEERGRFKLFGFKIGHGDKPKNENEIDLLKR